ncbi:MAG: divergent polysaccharide deacetylase family protein [Bdellovibrionales bacterium]|jgi:polysaccharide deacetylase 2 family uncharacterized protein YibQ|nr:divergent polysaccharide deacetylase family protein [Bdellovibrionales bacterium]
MREDLSASDGKTGKAGSFWARLSPAYKKRFIGGIFLYLLLTGLVGFWVYTHADNTLQKWNARIPQATLQIGDTAPYTDAAVPPSGDIDSGNTDLVDIDTAEEPLQSQPQENTLPAGKTARIAIIVTDTGLIESTTLRVMKDLPQNVGMAFSPYSLRLQPWLEEAHAQNREAYLLLPMEPLTYPKDDPGPRALLSRKSEAENRIAIQWLLSHKPVTGVMNFMGSRFLADRRNMMPMLEQLKRRGLVFIENPAMAGLQSAVRLADEAGVKYMPAALQIDTHPQETAIRIQLSQLEKIAEEKGYALGIAAPYPVSIDLLAKWTEGLAARGFELVKPASLLQYQNTTTGTP